MQGNFQPIITKDNNEQASGRIIPCIKQMMGTHKRIDKNIIRERQESTSLISPHGQQCDKISCRVEILEDLLTYGVCRAIQFKSSTFAFAKLPHDRRGRRLDHPVVVMVVTSTVRRRVQSRRSDAPQERCTSWLRRIVDHFLHFRDGILIHVDTVIKDSVAEFQMISWTMAEKIHRGNKRIVMSWSD